MTQSELHSVGILAEREREKKREWDREREGEREEERERGRERERYLPQAHQRTNCLQGTTCTTCWFQCRVPGEVSEGPTPHLC